MPRHRLSPLSSVLLLLLGMANRCLESEGATSDLRSASTLELALAAAEAITEEYAAGRIDYSRPG